MLGRSVVRDNTGLYPSYLTEVVSGVINTGRLVLDDRTRITSNIGGSGVLNSGTLVMNGSSNISASDFGRGVSGVTNSGTLVMNDASSISEQGPVTNSGTLVMNDASSIHHNRITGGMSAAGRDRAGASATPAPLPSTAPPASTTTSSGEAALQPVTGPV